MLHKETLILLALTFLSIVSLSQENGKELLFENTSYEFSYQLDKPDRTWSLPKKLIEISGLSFIDDHRLACVQDEKGKIYVFNMKSGKIEKKIDFAKDGDYEGIAIVRNDIWVLKSNGNLYRVKKYIKETQAKAKKYSTLLSGKNDPEGLTYNPVDNQLLIACKGHPFIDDREGKRYKAIYSFDLKTKQLDLEPFLLMDMDTIKYYKGYNAITHLGVEFLAYLNTAKGDVSFQPSGMAIHPISGNIFVLASIGNLLVVYSRSGELLAMIELKSKYHLKPEGICFSPDATLYIANEGDDYRKGTILKFYTKN
ncbi:MAG: hypothetical protein GQ527_09525 [Bacteroidales bacterium]|nr:hypothetical protein [Bacteroidales bacterium]